MLHPKAVRQATGPRGEPRVPAFLALPFHFPSYILSLCSESVQFQFRRWPCDESLQPT